MKADTRSRRGESGEDNCMWSERMGKSKMGEVKGQKKKRDERKGNENQRHWIGESRNEDLKFKSGGKKTKKGYVYEVKGQGTENGIYSKEKSLKLKQKRRRKEQDRYL